MQGMTAASSRNARFRKLCCVEDGTLCLPGPAAMPLACVLNAPNTAEILTLNMVPAGSHILSGCKVNLERKHVMRGDTHCAAIMAQDM